MKLIDDFKKKAVEEGIKKMVEDATVSHCKPQVEIWDQYPYDDNFKRLAWRHIERCARICYKSEPKDDTFECTQTFINGLKKRGHTSPFAHAAIYLTEDVELCSNGQMKSKDYLYKWFANNKYSKVNIIKNSDGNATAYITTNWRVYIEHQEELDNLNIFDYETTAKQYHEKRITVHITGAQIAITREINRHTASSVCEQSTRYCNYSKDKFGGDVTYSLPHWWDNEDADPDQQYWLKAGMVFSNLIYKKLIELGMRPEDARYVLPLGTFTEEAITMFESDWKHFFEMRTAPAAHPDCRIIATMIEEQIDKKYNGRNTTLD